MTKAYTGSGDNGYTARYGESGRHPKSALLFEALGNLDELNAAIGWAITQLPKSRASLIPLLRQIQAKLLDIGADLATPLNSKHPVTRLDISSVQTLEKWIDETNENLEQLKTFILPGGHVSSAAFHLVRAICRRTERSVVAVMRPGLVDGDCRINPEIIPYLNRLSTFFFVLARWLNAKMRAEEIRWLATPTESEEPVIPYQ